MAIPIELIVDRQIRRWELEKSKPESVISAKRAEGPIITISRQRGSNGSLVAELLAGMTGFTLISRDIIDQISADIGVQKRLVETLDEGVRSSFELWVEGLFKGRIVDSSDYIKSLARIIGAISRHGYSIIVGRGANFLLGMHRGFHVRIVADYDFRVKTIADRKKISEAEARADIDRTDEQRRKFIKTHFDRDIDDPRAYDIMINGTHFTSEQMARTILGIYPTKVLP